MLTFSLLKLKYLSNEICECATFQDQEVLEHVSIELIFRGL